MRPVAASALERMATASLLWCSDLALYRKKRCGAIFAQIAAHMTIFGNELLVHGLPAATPWLSRYPSTPCIDVQMWQRDLQMSKQLAPNATMYYHSMTYHATCIPLLQTDEQCTAIDAVQLAQTTG